jgi:hypothetical protein
MNTVANEKYRRGSRISLQWNTWRARRVRRLGQFRGYLDRCEKRVTHVTIKMHNASDEAIRLVLG